MFEKEKRLESTESKINHQRSYFDKILFAIGCVYLLGILLWLASQKKLYLPFVSKSVNGTVAQNSQISDSDAQFIDYLQRSLAALDQKAAMDKQKTSISEVNSDDTLPPSPLTGNQFPKKQPNLAIAPLSVPPPPLPAIAPSPEKILTPPPSTSRFRSRSESTVPVPKAKASLPKEPSPSSESIRASLVGLLELNNRVSAGLFTINGVTERVYVGEAIGSTGWVLTSVKNQKAAIQSNQEVRSISVGENF